MEITQSIAIVGHTGAGKTTVAKRLSDISGVPLVTFSQIGKRLAESRGYKRLRDCFADNLHDVSKCDVFLSEFNQYLVDSILGYYHLHHCIIIEGLISYDAILVLKKEIIEMKLFYLDVPLKVRIQRVRKRLSCTEDEAFFEERLKDRDKRVLGVYETIGLANYVINGSNPIDEIVSQILTYTK